MKCVYSREMTILPSVCDFTGRLSVPDTFALFMDIATEHAETLGIGLGALAQRDLFWLTARTRARFIRRPRMTERVTLSTWPETPERSRCNRDYLVTANGETLIEGKTEWMVMNMKTGRLHPADSLFSGDLDLEDRRVLPGPFMRMDEDFSGAKDLGTYTVRATDIDIGGHMNNTAYLRVVAGVFSTEEWKALNIRELEAAYRTPCFEGDALMIQRRETDAGVELRLSREDRTVLLVRLVCDKA